MNATVSFSGSSDVQTRSLHNRLCAKSGRPGWGERIEPRIDVEPKAAEERKKPRYLFHEHIQRLGKHEKALIELDEKMGPASFTPTDLAESLLHQIAGDASRVPDKALSETQTRWIARIADYVIGPIKARGRDRACGQDA